MRNGVVILALLFCFVAAVGAQPVREPTVPDPNRTAVESAFRQIQRMEDRLPAPDFEEPLNFGTLDCARLA